MQYCEKCKIRLTGSLHRCPLCQSDLNGNPDTAEDVFPVVPPTPHPHRNMIRLIAFCTIVVAAICIAINLIQRSGGWWSMFVVAGIASLWLTFAVIAKKRDNIPKNILWQVALVSLLALGWDWYTGFRGWSIDYVLPILCCCSMVAMIVIGQIMKMRIQDYIVYLIIDIIFGIIPLILILCGVLKVIYPSAICVAGSIVFLGALLVFEGGALRDEITRRIHL